MWWHNIGVQSFDSSVMGISPWDICVIGTYITINSSGFALFQDSVRRLNAMCQKTWMKRETFILRWKKQQICLIASEYCVQLILCRCTIIQSFPLLNICQALSSSYPRLLPNFLGVNVRPMSPPSWSIDGVFCRGRFSCIAESVEQILHLVR